MNSNGKGAIDLARPKKRRALVVVLVGITVSGIFLWLALRQVKTEPLLQALRSADPLFMAPLLLALGVFCWLKAWRWKVLLTPVGQTTIRGVMPATMIGYMGNILLPAYLGELVRLHVIGRSYGFSASAVLGSLVLERLFDLLTVLFVIAAGLVLGSNIPEQLQVAGHAIGLIAMLLVVFVLLFVFANKKVMRVVTILLAIFPVRIRDWIIEQLGLVAIGLNALRSPRLIIRTVAMSVAQWTVMGLGTYASLLAVDLQVPISAGFIVMALAMAGMTLPSSPGFIGTIQLAFVLGLTPYDVDHSAAFAASVYYHVIVNVSILLAGLFYLKITGEQLFRRSAER